jgi:hypothetical protein
MRPIRLDGSREERRAHAGREDPARVVGYDDHAAERDVHESGG